MLNKRNLWYVFSFQPPEAVPANFSIQVVGRVLFFSSVLGTISTRVPGIFTVCIEKTIESQPRMHIFSSTPPKKCTNLIFQFQNAINKKYESLLVGYAYKIQAQGRNFQFSLFPRSLRSGLKGMPLSNGRSCRKVLEISSELSHLYHINVPYSIRAEIQDGRTLKIYSLDYAKVRQFSACIQKLFPHVLIRPSSD